jgi:putative intracellular protease/amidase
MKRTTRVCAAAVVLGAALTVTLVARRHVGSAPATEPAAALPSPADETATTRSNVYVTSVAAAATAYPVPKPQEPGEMSATEHASALREELCECETLACLDAVNARYVKTMGSIAASTYDETSRAEMRAAGDCVRRLWARLADAGP